MPLSTFHSAATFRERLIAALVIAFTVVISNYVSLRLTRLEIEANRRKGDDILAVEREILLRLPTATQPAAEVPGGG